MAETSAAFRMDDAADVQTNGTATWGIWVNGVEQTQAGSTTNRVWNEWTNDTSTATTTVAGTADGTWQYWMIAAGTNGAQPTVTNTTIVWESWNSEWQLQATPETDDQKEEREKREEERKEAEEKAAALLQEVLTDKQRETYRERKVIPITAKSGRRYEVGQGRLRQVDKNGKGIESYCIHPESGYPFSDVILTQLCWLRWCEEEFLKTANATPIREAA